VKISVIETDTATSGLRWVFSYAFRADEVRKRRHIFFE
jgi:hypothetical protein